MFRAEGIQRSESKEASIFCRSYYFSFDGKGGWVGGFSSFDGKRGLVLYHLSTKHYYCPPLENHGVTVTAVSYFASVNFIVTTFLQRFRIHLYHI